MRDARLARGLVQHARGALSTALLLPLLLSTALLLPHSLLPFHSPPPFPQPSSVPQLTLPSTALFPQVLGHFDVGESFGAQGMLEEDGERKARTVTITAETHLKCLAVTRETLGEYYELIRAGISREVANRQWQLANWGRVTIDRMRCGGFLGTGFYGSVFEAQSDDSGGLYAVKIVSKAKLLSRQHVIQALHERALLGALNHPNIQRLVGGCALDDPSHRLR